MAWEELKDLETWRKVSALGRRDVSERLASALGESFVVSDRLVGQEQLAAVRFLPTETIMAAVPGGRFLMGLRPEERAEILALAPERAQYGLASQVRYSEQTRSVLVSPFLLATVPMLETNTRKIIQRFEKALRPDYSDPKEPVPCHLTRTETVYLLKQTGMRLPSEAEWEYVAREGGTCSWIGPAPTSSEAEGAPVAQLLAESARYDENAIDHRTVNSFGMWGMLFGEWMADSWHESLAGAPADSKPWSPGTEPCVARGGAVGMWPWQNHLSYILSHTSIRHLSQLAVSVWGVRLARDLPRV